MQKKYDYSYIDSIDNLITSGNEDCDAINNFLLRKTGYLNTKLVGCSVSCSKINSLY